MTLRLALCLGAVVLMSVACVCSSSMSIDTFGKCYPSMQSAGVQSISTSKRTPMELAPDSTFDTYCLKQHKGEQWFTVEVPALTTYKVRFNTISAKGITTGLSSNGFTSVDVKTGIVPAGGGSVNLDHVFDKKGSSDAGSSFCFDVASRAEIDCIIGSTEFSPVSGSVSLKNTHDKKREFLVYFHVHAVTMHHPMPLQVMVDGMHETCPEEDETVSETVPRDQRVTYTFCMEGGGTSTKKSAAFFMDVYDDDILSLELTTTTTDASLLGKLTMKWAYVYLEDSNASPFGSGNTVTLNDFKTTSNFPPASWTTVEGLVAIEILYDATTPIQVTVEAYIQSADGVAVVGTDVPDVGTQTLGEGDESIIADDSGCIVLDVTTACFLCTTGYYRRFDSGEVCVETCHESMVPVGSGADLAYCYDNSGILTSSMADVNALNDILRFGKGNDVLMTFPVEIRAVDAGAIPTDLIAHVLVAVMNKYNVLCVSYFKDAEKTGEDNNDNTGAKIEAKWLQLETLCGFADTSTKVVVLSSLERDIKSAVSSDKTRQLTLPFTRSTMSGTVVAMGDFQYFDASFKEISGSKAQSRLSKAALSKATSSWEDFEEFVKEYALYVGLAGGALFLILIGLCLCCCGKCSKNHQIPYSPVY
jgi:hypothetical protein